MSSVSSSDSNCASFLSSEPSLRGSDGLPADSVFFEITEAARDQLRLHAATSAETWTCDYAVNVLFPVEPHITSDTENPIWHPCLPTIRNEGTSSTQVLLPSPIRCECLHATMTHNAPIYLLVHATNQDLLTLESLWRL